MPRQPPCMPPARTGTEMNDNQQGEHTAQMVTYTFLSEMLPPPAGVDPIDLTSVYPHDKSQPTTPQRMSHGKRRDASYIPRPPNAFILFRSSFIRDQKVTNKVEGNHSNLSKIIGMYWRTLTREQRDEWEAKAAQALIEHRKRYPDWRFRPAANAGALNVKPKAKSKDGARRGRASKDPPDCGGGSGEEESEDGLGRGRGRTMTRDEDEQSRLTKIAGLLVEGQEGEALERAVEQWEAGRRRSESISLSAASSPVLTRASASASVPVSASTKSTPSTSPVITRSHASNSIGPATTTAEKDPTIAESSLDTISTPKNKPSSLSPSTPTSISTPSRSIAIFEPPPSWPASPITPRSLASNTPTPGPWPTSPATPRISISFPTFTAPSTEDWEADQRQRVIRSGSISASPSPVITRASTATTGGGLSALAPAPSLSCLSSPGTPLRSTYTTSIPVSIPRPPLSWPASPMTPQTLPTSPSVPATSTSYHPFFPEEDWEGFIHTPSASASSSPVRAHASAAATMIEGDVSTFAPAPSLSCLYPVSSPKDILSSSSPRTYTPTIPVSIPRPPPPSMTPSTPIHWPTSPSLPPSSTSYPAFISTPQDWEGVQKFIDTRSLSKSSSPVRTHASASATTLEVDVSTLAPSLSRSCMYTPSTLTNIFSSSSPRTLRQPTSTPPSTSTSTPTIPISIPKSSPSWRAPPEPVAPQTLASEAWPPSLVAPRLSTSFPAFSPAENWEIGCKAPRMTSSPVTRRASPRTATATDGETSVLNQSVSTRTRTPTPASPIASHSIPAETLVYNPSLSNLPTSTSSRRSRSPTFKSPSSNSTSPNASMSASTKRSLSAPAPYRQHHRHQEPVTVRTEAGFWWSDAAGMEMGMGIEEPTREGSFDLLSAGDQEYVNVGGSVETNEWGCTSNWSDFDATVMYHSATIFPDQTTIAPPADPVNIPPSERWFNPWDADTPFHAGESFHPLTPTPISISTSPHSLRAPRSSFSSLAGWDGTCTEPAIANGSGSGTCAMGKTKMVWGGNLNGLQRVGVEGGGY